MTNKAAFINENDNDSHLDLQLLFENKDYYNYERGVINLMNVLLITFYCKIQA